MPCIMTKTNMAITEEKETALKKRFGEAASLIGKSENWLMLSFEDNCRLYFQGSKEEPMAFTAVKLFGSADSDAYEKMTARLTDILSEELGISPDHIYVQYEETAYWGWNGRNF